MNTLLLLSDQLYSLSQDGRSLVEYAQEFMELASAANLKDEEMMTFFHVGLDKPLYLLMPWNTSNCTLEQYVLYALLLSRSTPEKSFSLPVISAPVMATSPKSAPESPESACNRAADLLSLPVMAADLQSSPIRAANHQPSPIRFAELQSSPIMASDCQISHIIAAVLEALPVKATSTESIQNGRHPRAFLSVQSSP